MTSTSAAEPWFPDAQERTRLNADLLEHGTDTGWYDDNGAPAPWPDDIDEWRPASYVRTPQKPSEHTY